MGIITKIVKRNKSVVAFNSHKIREAVRKAFESQNIKKLILVEKLTDDVIKVINLIYSDEHLPSVEDIQDIIEKVIIKHNYPDVAKAFILYRARHKELREQETLAKIEQHTLFIKGEKDELYPFEPEIIRDEIRDLSFGLSHINLDDLVSDICKNVYEGITLKEVKNLIINSSKTRIEKHYDYSSLSSRILLSELYQNILGVGLKSQELSEKYSEKFKDYINLGIKLEILNAELKDKFDLIKLSKALFSIRDLKFQYLGIQTLSDRYLLRTRDTKKVFELPQWMWMRVAMGLAILEDNPTERAIEFYNVLSNFYLMNSTPTLFNSGTMHSQMSSCYLNTVEDSLEGIFKTYSDNAMLSKWAGGIGTDWTPVRGTGAQIKGTNGSSSGIIPFIKIFNDVAIAVNQGGKRKGAMAAYLENWHIDIEEFLDLRKNTGDERRRAHDIHPAVFITDFFMKRVQQNADWTLFTPDLVPDLHNAYGKDFEEKYMAYEKQGIKGAKTVKAFDLWKKILTMMYETGHPWIAFKCASNIRSPQDHAGVIHSSNLCTEITLNSSKDEAAVCNLASINMSEMICDGSLDETLIKNTVTTGIRMLDNVIDLNYYPIKEAENANSMHRPIGLGVMGYQDALYKLGISFDSDENVEFADRSMEMISFYAILASSQLAGERGSYKTFNGSKWDKGILPLDTLDLLEQERGKKLTIDRNSSMLWDIVRESIKKYGMRNSNTMAIAPTATIANITGVVPCVEPIYKNIYMKENLSGSFCVINKHLVDELEKVGLWNDEILALMKINNGSIRDIDIIPAEIRKIFKEVFEINPEWIIKAVAKRSKWIDQSASTNLFINTRKGKEISRLYQMIWDSGIKTSYYLRTIASSQITKMTTQSEIIKTEDTLDEIPSVTEAIKVCLLNDPDCEACQ